MLSHSIDVVRLVGDIKELAAEIRSLKNILRQTWTCPMGEHQQRLVKLKLRVTELCVVRAALRGRYHLRKPLRAGSYPGMKWDADTYRNRVVERIAPQYEAVQKAS